MRDHKETCLKLLKKIAALESFEEYADAQEELKSQEIRVMPKAASCPEWVDKTWLPIHQVNLMKSVGKKDLF